MVYWFLVVVGEARCSGLFGIIDVFLGCTFSFGLALIRTYFLLCIVVGCQ